MSANLLEKARANRLIALEILKQRDSNLFVLAEARKSAKRRQRQLVFSTRRKVSPQRVTCVKQAA